MVIARFKRVNFPVRLDVRVAAPGCFRRGIPTGSQSMDVSSVCGSRLSSTTSNQSPNKAVEPHQVHKESRERCVLACVHVCTWMCLRAYVQPRGLQSCGSCIGGACKRPGETMCKEAIVSFTQWVSPSVELRRRYYKNLFVFLYFFVCTPHFNYR